MQNNTADNSNSTQNSGNNTAGANTTPASNVSQNVQNAANNVNQGVQDLTKNAQAGVENLGQNVQQGMNNVGSNLQSGVNNVAGNVGNVVGGATNTLKGVANTIGGKPVNQPAVTRDEKLFAALAYLPFVAIISLIMKPDSAFVRMHARQGLMLSLIFFTVGIAAAIVAVVPVVGGFLAMLLALVPAACMFVGIYSLYLSLTGFWWKIPVVGVLSEVIPIEMFAKVAKENISGQIGVAREDYQNRQDTLAQEHAEKTISTQAPLPQTGENHTPVAGTDTQNQNAANGSASGQGPKA
ncbi:MAG: hypothetical protein ACRCZE_03935 [Candidatus Altimarinota bacterium]